MQVSDTREELRNNLILWKKRMLNKIERIHEELLGEYFIKVLF